MRRSFLLACTVFLTTQSLPADYASSATLPLFDFESESEIKAWGNLPADDARQRDTKGPEPDALIERSSDHATSGKQSLKVTFAGGVWPTVIAPVDGDDWTHWKTFHADVTATQPGIVGFCIMQEKSSRASGWDGGVSRWAKTQLLQPGKNHISAILHPNEWSSVRTKLENGRVLGKIASLEIFLYRPQKGEAIYIDNIHLSAAPLPPPTPTANRFSVLGTDLTVKNVQELGKQLADQWTMPESQSAEEIETAFRKKYQVIRQSHPKSVLAVFRDGQKGYDPADPEKVYDGWQDAYWSSHGPDSLTVDRSENFGKSATQEIFMRHRSPLLKVDLSSIPKGSTILAAEFLMVRAGDPAKEHTPLKPNMWAIEPCNRPWSETEVDAYRYAANRYWKEIGGMSWDGSDPDFLPVFVAHGPSQPNCCHWDFTNAIRLWTDGRHPNHGFMLHGDSKDWFRAWFREAPEIKNRPAVLVIYERP